MGLCRTIIKRQDKRWATRLRRRTEDGLEHKLAGMREALRQQTIERLKRELVKLDNQRQALAAELARLQPAVAKEGRVIDLD